MAWCGRPQCTSRLRRSFAAHPWFNGQPAVQIDSSTGDMAWYFNDHLGTPILQTDATASEIWHVERDPYGTPFATITGPTRHQPLALPGQEQNGELSYNIFRWYRAGWGRYTQADPMIKVDRSRTDVYSYVEGRPITHVDPFGLFGQKGCCPDEELQEILRRVNEVRRSLEKATGGKKIAWTPTPLATTDCYPMAVNRFLFGWEGTPFTDYDTDRYDDAGGCVQKCVRAHEQVHRRTCRVAGASAMMKEPHSNAYGRELECLMNLLPRGVRDAMDYTGAASGR
jgi:RHS repeat-associated protein